MADFGTSLLREKFSILDPEIKGRENNKPVIALSNRMVADMKSGDKYHEEFVIRAHNMHSCTRMTALVLQSFYQGGPIMNRHTPFDWSASWDKIVNEYEYAYNPQRWIAVYHKGRIVFEAGEHHMLLDVIEQCDARNTGQYDESVALAEDAFKQLGKTVTIDHDSNVALVVTFEDNECRVGVIMRGPDRTTTFNFKANGTKEKPLNTPQCLSGAAAFLEGIQLAFMVGMNNEKIRLGIIKRFSNEEKQTKEAKKRLSRLSAEVANMEAAHDVHYRPERPEFPHVIIDAEKLAQQILEPPEDSDDDEEPEETEN